MALSVEYLRRASTSYLHHEMSSIFGIVKKEKDCVGKPVEEGGGVEKRRIQHTNTIQAYIHTYMDIKMSEEFSEMLIIT